MANPLRQIFGADHSIAHCGPSDHRVLELAYISRPLISLKQFHGLRRESNARTQGIYAAGKALGQGGNVFAAFSERREHQRYRIESIEKIVAKSPRGNFFF